jgi:adenylate cyclase
MIHATKKKLAMQTKSSEKIDKGIKDLTVLYLDVAGFTPFYEKNSSEDVIAMLNDFFGLSEVITKKFQGDIDKFIGDAIMAVFVDANDAVAAAKEILKSLSLLNKKRARQDIDPINVRIGINSGKVMQGKIGTHSRKDLTVVGDTVNTAARIQQAAQINAVSISEAILSRLKNPRPFELDRIVSLKGKRQSVSIYKLIVN